MTLSTYLLTRGFGYSPKARLSEQEKALLQPLSDCRLDVINYTNALHAMTDNVRRDMFRRNSYIVGWLQRIAPVVTLLDEYLKVVMHPNRLPKRTRKEVAKL